ncbi:DUF3540 domain-containing protein [Aliagarivorans marinus]|uniref:DUF3540 domain-containing protein n=1 Tax=Aliagarivorans marinus TaxID=561965 RepID=UPI00042169A3|nr:DUF3540 domain-containing protein [Aliagarivorans marinus]
MKPYIAYDHARECPQEQIAESAISPGQSSGAQQPVAYCTGVITALPDDGSANYLIDQHVHAELALSALVEPQLGDRVAYLGDESGCFVLHILKRKSPQTLQLRSATPIAVHAPELTLSADKQLDLVSLNRFSLTGQHGVVSVSGTLVSCAEHMVKQVNQLMVTAKGLLRLSGRQQVITAEQDVRIDGERINMG